MNEHDDKMNTSNHLVPLILIYADLMGSGNSRCMEMAERLISEHLKHIFDSGELIKEATVRKFRTVRQEGNRSVSRTIDFFNLDVIISVGYRVNTVRGIQFRQWANKVIKDYLLRGYSVNQRLLYMENRRFGDCLYKTH